MLAHDGNPEAHTTDDSRNGPVVKAMADSPRPNIGALETRVRVQGTGGKATLVVTARMVDAQGLGTNDSR